jgi:hypothetical protein
MTSNRLPILAAEIRNAHGGVRKALKTAAECAVEAGRALIEAKSLLKHGEWLPWLKTHCRLPERTAQLYMHVAEVTDQLGPKSATVADLGLRFLGKMNIAGAFEYDPFAHCNAEDKRQWGLFILFGVHHAHVEWLLHQWSNPDEWLGEEGAKYRSIYRQLLPRWREPSKRFLERWKAFQEQHAATSIAEIEAALARLPDAP